MNGRILRIIQYIYDPGHYYERVACTAVNLNPANKHRPGIIKIFQTVKALLKVCAKAGFNKTTGRPYWKMLFTVLFKNPRALEAAISLAAMFIHFHKQSEFVIDLTNKEIKYIERMGEEKYNQSRLQEAGVSFAHPEQIT